jgi:hypothetical protein
VVFNSCIFSHIQGWGVEFARYGTNETSGWNQVTNSELYDLGAGGIRIGRYPGASTGTDTDSNVPQYNMVENNVITSAGRIQPSGIGTGIWVGNAHHNVIAHNDVSDLYSGAIGIGFTFGITNKNSLSHDNIVAFNHLYTLGQGVTSDFGGIYLATSATTGNMVLNNVVHDITHDYLDPDGYGGEGIYFDQGTSNAIAQNNLVYRLSSSGLFNNLSDHTSDIYPQNNTVVNNIFALSGQVTIQHGGNNPNSLNYIRNIDYFDMGDVQGGNWACYDIGGSGKPEPCPTRFLLDANDYWNPQGNAPMFETTYPQDQTYTLSQWQPLGEDVHSFNVDPLFTNPNQTNDPPANGFTLQATSPVFTDIGFVNFDPTQAGRSNPVLIPPTITCSGVPTLGACPAFPLQLLNQENGY